MVEAKELRKGNYVDIVTCYPKEKIILEIREDSVVTTDGYTRTLPWIHGMYITEERLLKFGFEKTNRIDSGELKPCYAIFSFALMIRHNSYFIDWIGGNTEIKYIHELQNLYFALTRNELEW